MKIVIDIPDDATIITIGTIKDGEIDIQRYNSIYINNHKLPEPKNIPHVDEKWITNCEALKNPLYAGYNLCLKEILGENNENRR